LTLGKRLLLLGSPPAISILIQCIDETEPYQEFLSIIRDIFPECEQEILGQDSMEGRLNTFANRFEEKYFPLHCDFGDWMDGYGDLVYEIPITLMGIDWEDYHAMPGDYRAGMCLASYLFEDPTDESEGARIAIGEACAQHVPTEILERVPGKGLSMEDGHRLFDDTPHKALAMWGEVLFMSTGTLFLDVAREEQGYDRVEWDRGTVVELTRQWQIADNIMAQSYQMFEWLEKDPPAHFTEILDFIEKKGEVMNAEAPG